MVLASSNFLVPNATFVVELVAFLIVLGVLAKYVLPYITSAMDTRQATIRQALVDAEDAKRRAAEAETEYTRVVGDARTQARSIVEEANRMADQMRTEKREQADREYEQRIAQAQPDIEAQTRRASEQLRQQAADLAIAVAEKVIGEGIDAQAQRSLIDRTIAEVQSQTGPAEVSA